MIHCFQSLFDPKIKDKTCGAVGLPTTAHSGVKGGGKEGERGEIVCESHRDRERKRLRAWRMEIGLQSKVYTQAPNQLQRG